MEQVESESEANVRRDPGNGTLAVRAREGVTEHGCWNQDQQIGEENLDSLRHRSQECCKPDKNAIRDWVNDELSEAAARIGAIPLG